MTVYIHALREEGDSPAMRTRPVMQYFYPRPPRGGRRRRSMSQHELDMISIHALREEGDIAKLRARSPPKYFYPRPPRGGRHQLTDRAIHYLNFYPRPPRGGRPDPAPQRDAAAKFLSTPSARRATRDFKSGVIALGNFYPRPPRGGRRTRHSGGTLLSNFYPRPPRGGRPSSTRRTAGI